MPGRCEVRVVGCGRAYRSIGMGGGYIEAGREICVFVLYIITILYGMVGITGGREK